MSWIAVVERIVLTLFVALLLSQIISAEAVALAAPLRLSGGTQTSDSLASREDPPAPGVPQPSPIDPTLFYNHILRESLPIHATETVQAAPDGATISPMSTALANGGTLSYPNAVRPQSCLTFDDLEQWASHGDGGGPVGGSVWSDYYAGWRAFAVDDGGFYRAANVVTSFDPTVGNQIAAKIGSTQPYAAGFRSPWFAVEAGTIVTVRIRYLIENPQTGRQAFDWISLGIKSAQSPTRYVNGYEHGRWAALENTMAVETDQFMVLIQAHNPAVATSAAYFDDVEILVGDVPFIDCAY